VRKIGLVVLWFGLGLAVTDLLALAMEEVLTTAPMRELLTANNRAFNPASARTDFVASLPRKP
jgi:hypothetical protein